MKNSQRFAKIDDLQNSVTTWKLLWLICIILIVILLIIITFFILVFYYSRQTPGCVPPPYVFLKYAGIKNEYHIILIERIYNPSNVDPSFFNIDDFRIPNSNIEVFSEMAPLFNATSTIYNAKKNYTLNINSSILYQDSDNNDKISEGDQILISTNILPVGTRGKIVLRIYGILNGYPQVRTSYLTIPE